VSERDGIRASSRSAMKQWLLSIYARSVFIRWTLWDLFRIGRRPSPLEMADIDHDDTKPCPERDCMLRLDHRGKHRYGKDDPLVRKMQELGKDRHS